MEPVARDTTQENDSRRASDGLLFTEGSPVWMSGTCNRCQALPSLAKDPLRLDAEDQAELRGAL